jgi:regulator of replication initiation timing
MDVVDDIADLDNEVYELHLQIEDLKEAVAILQNEGVE